MSPASRIGIALLALAAVGGAFFWWRGQQVPPPPAPPVTRPVAPVALEPPPPAPAAPTIQHPVDAPRSASRGALPPLDESDDHLKNALGELLGGKAVPSFLIVDALARRFVATVNNLATDTAAAQLWPVKRTAGQLVTEARSGATTIGGSNAERYAGFVRLIEGVDTQRAVALYTRLYPLFQRAYEDLGFPGKYFNDRVVEVIDHLLATPDLAEPIKVKRVVMAGATAPPGAGGLYLFEDSALEASSSGQKILLRMGRVNAGKLKAKLADIRQRLAKGPVAPRPQ